MTLQESLMKNKDSYNVKFCVYDVENGPPVSNLSHQKLNFITVKDETGK